MYNSDVNTRVYSLKIIKFTLTEIISKWLINKEFN